MIINGIDINIQKIKSSSKNKNEAIKKVREITGCTLYDAMNLVEKNYIVGLNASFEEKIKLLEGFDSFGTKKEIKYLRGMMMDGEEVFAVASGIMDGNTWLIACTNKRIIFVDCGMIYGVKHSEVMIDKVNAVSYKNGLMFGEIHIEDGASTRIIKNVQKYSTKPFVDAVHKVIELTQMENEKTIQQSLSVADELLKFKQLFDMGVITNEEFDKQKERLLN